MPTLEPILPTPDDRRFANEAARVLSSHARNKSETVQIILPSENDLPEETVFIPKQAFTLLQNLLTQMAKGNAVSLVPQHAELTTKQAADFLGVSRPFLVKKLLEKNIIKHNRVGTHRRIAFEELIKYRNNRQKEYEKVMQELTEISQENDMGY